MPMNRSAVLAAVSLCLAGANPPTDHSNQTCKRPPQSICPCQRSSAAGAFCDAEAYYVLGLEGDDVGWQDSVDDILRMRQGLQRLALKVSASTALETRAASQRLASMLGPEWPLAAESIAPFPLRRGEIALQLSSEFGVRNAAAAIKGSPSPLMCRGVAGPLHLPCFAGGDLGVICDENASYRLRRDESAQLALGLKEARIVRRLGEMYPTLTWRVVIGSKVSVEEGTLVGALSCAVNPKRLSILRAEQADVRLVPIGDTRVSDPIP